MWSKSVELFNPYEAIMASKNNDCVNRSIFGKILNFFKKGVK